MIAKSAGELSRLVEFLITTRLDDIPADVLDDGHRLLLDTVACVVGGSREKDVVRLAERFAIDGGPSTILGTARRSSSTGAALVGFVAGSWYDLDAGHRHPSRHPPVPGSQPALHIAPPLLAVAEAVDLPFEEALRIFVLAYEVTARLCVATVLRPGLHGHGMQPTIGAAVAAALARGRDRAVLERTVALAASLMVMGPMNVALAGATARNAFGALGTVNGLLAAELAVGGFESSFGTLSTILTRVGSIGLDWEKALGDLGERWEAPLHYFKQYACCRWNHPALDAFAEVLAAHALQPDKIVGIDVETFNFAAQLTEASPRSELGAKFSIPFALAAFAVLGHAGPAAFQGQNLSRRDILELARRVSVSENASYTAAMPRRLTSVEVRTSDGRKLRCFVDGTRGDHSSPFDSSVLENKFLDLMGAVLGVPGAEQALECWSRREERKSIREAIGSLRSSEPVLGDRGGGKPMAG